MPRAFAVAIQLFSVVALFAQTFEVASVKPNRSGSGNSSTYYYQGELRMENTTLKVCIEQAFELKDFSLSGPNWLETERFDILAKPPAGATPDQFMPMLRALLVERFRLVYHRDSKLVPAYALIVAKKGPKLQPVKQDSQPSNSSGRGMLRADRVTMAQFAELLSRQLDRPIRDLTHVPGIYGDIHVEWVPEDAGPDAPPGPSLFTAIQEQLGLRLESRKLPIDVLVVDHIERVPTEN